MGTAVIRPMVDAAVAYNVTGAVVTRLGSSENHWETVRDAIAGSGFELCVRIRTGYHAWVKSDAARSSGPLVRKETRRELNVMADDKQRIDALINCGLFDQWYAVAKSVQVQPGVAHAVKALGRNLVLWRDTGGQLHCLEDYCPHRGAKLSRGEILGDNIACRYHGVTLDGSGTVVRVPAMPGCALEGRRPVESFPIEEANDAIFVYFASAEHPDPAPLTLPEEVTSPEWSAVLCVAPWACNYRFALDNLADPMHGSYLHHHSYTLSRGARSGRMRAVELPDGGFLVEREGQRGVNFDWIEVHQTGALWCRLDIPYPRSAGPGRSTGIWPRPRSGWPARW